MDSTEAPAGLVNVEPNVTDNEHHDERLFREQADLLDRDQRHCLGAAAPPTRRTAGLHRPQRHHRDGNCGNTLARSNRSNGVFPCGPGAMDDCNGGSATIDDPSYAVVGPVRRPGRSRHTRRWLPKSVRRMVRGDPGVWPVASLPTCPARRRQPRRHGGHQRPDGRAGPLRPDRHDLDQGEFTGDGTVDINDLTIVLAHYGQSVGASAAGVAAVPEPASWAMLAAALSAAAWAVARRRNQPKRR